MNNLDFINLSDDQVELMSAANSVDATVLITGSTGSGKSHLAHWMHQSSKRVNAKWCKINLATLSESIIESELFGHEKGAFTGADLRRVGRLEICSGGTVFLDEIGELSPRLQSKLLDFIQYKKITPVGSNREVTLDVRIIAATNKNLEEAVAKGEFRADLYHRLNVFNLKLRSLAENKASVLLLAESFLRKFCADAGKMIRSLSTEAKDSLLKYSWPGNIRELENAMEYSVAMEKTEYLTAKSLPRHVLNGDKKMSDEKTDEKTSAVSSGAEKIRIESLANEVCGYMEIPISADYHDCRDVFEKAYLEYMLRVCKGQINQTSKRIGLNKVSMTDKIRKFGIDWKRIKDETFVHSDGLCDELSG